MIKAGFLGTGFLGAMTLVIGLTAAGAARAGDCNADIGGLSMKRQGFIDKLNTIAKASKGKLDPVASCPVLRSLVAAESQLFKYLEANKAWCNIPDETLNGMKAASTKSVSFAGQACQAAAQVAEQRKQATANPTLGIDAQKLPAGPL